jgi:hypothetical protein
MPSTDGAIRAPKPEHVTLERYPAQSWSAASHAPKAPL